MIEYANVENPKASLPEIWSSCVRAWYDKKLDFIKKLGGLIIGKTDIRLLQLIKFKNGKNQKVAYKEI